MLAVSSSIISLFALAVSGTAQDAAAPKSAVDIVAEAPASDWRTIDPENLLVMDLPSGQIIIEMRPDMAPAHVEQIKTLTRMGFYDGIIFHRVIEGFMAQGGDPTGTGSGDSPLENIPGEFARPLADGLGAHLLGRDDRAAEVGFIGTVPVGTQAPTLNKFLAQQEPILWGLHCRGVMSMARTNDPNSANSQFFLMFGDSRDNLDQSYTVWGKIVDGYHNARRINRGEPPVRPTPIVRMRMMADIPADEQTKVEALQTNSDTFIEMLKTARIMTEDGFVRNTCAIDVPVRINGEIPS